MTAQAGQSVTVAISQPDMSRLCDLEEDITAISEPFPTPPQLVEACVLYALDRDRGTEEWYRLCEYARERAGR